MIDDPNPMVRIASILSAAQHRRDDLLPMIRALATHANIAEQEACATAIGTLKDSKSIPLLKRMTRSTTPEVRLAALSSLYHLGELSSKEAIEEIAHTGNLFAIQELATITGSEETLTLLVQHSERHIRLNASMALLERKDPHAIPGILEILLRDSKDLGFQPTFSLGHSLKAWKVIPSSQQHSKEPFMDLSPISLGLREHLLTLALELPEPHFLRIADQIFQTNQLDLVPKTCLLLENMRTENALRLLRSYALDGHPLTRAYCSLILFRLKEEGPYEQAIYSWIARSKKEALLKFRPNLPRNQQLSSSGLLTPEERSRLLIESYATIASSHTEQSIDTLLEVIQESHENNRYALAGLLLRAIQ